jgi:membrane associated rhomboid family serine protease
MTFTITLCIIIITALVSLTSFSNPKAINDLSMWPVMIDNRRQYYRFITSGFIHGDFMHLLFNMFTLYFFGPIVEKYLFPGPVLFIGFYLCALVVSDLPSYFKHRKDYNYMSIGASGAVSAVLFASILINPWGTIVLYFFKMPAIVFAVLYVIYSVYAGKRRMDNINHDAHLGGALFGVVASLAFHPDLLTYFIQQLAHPSFDFGIANF